MQLHRRWFWQCDSLLQSSLSVLLPTFLFSMKKDCKVNVRQWMESKEGQEVWEGKLWWGSLDLQP